MRSSIHGVACLAFLLAATGGHASAGRGDLGATDTCSQQAKLLPDDPAAHETFGFSVSLDGNTALVGARFADEGSNSGSVHVFTRIGSSWSQQAVLLPDDDGGSSAAFGSSVSIDGDTALVGAPQDDENGHDSGSVYVFTRSGTTWSRQARLLPDDGASEDMFGTSVSVDGDTALVGAPRDDDNGFHSGSAYVFTRSGTSWTQQGKLLAADGALEDGFGMSVSVDGNTALLGALGSDDVGSNSGSAYVFVRSGASWSQQAKLLHDDGTSNDIFGNAVSVDGDTALIGATRDDDNGSDSGSAYVFARSGTTWSQQAKLLPADGAIDDLFGWSVSVDADTALVGAQGSDDVGSNSGSAYVFARSGTSWSLHGKIVPDDGEPHDFFGWSISVDDDTALVSARFSVDGRHRRSDAGAAYVFTCQGLTDCETNADCDDDDPCTEDSCDAELGCRHELASRAPVAESGGPHDTECNGAITTLRVDGTSSFDPDGDALTFEWTTTCPEGVFDDPTLADPVLAMKGPPPCPMTCEATLTVTDACGLSDISTTSVTVRDTRNPSLDAPAAGMTVPCDGAGNEDELNAWLADNGGARASDECGDVTWRNDFSDLSDDCGETGSAIVTFTAMDECGNETSTTARFLIIDTTDPSLDSPATDMTVECDGAGNEDELDAWLADNGGARASDACSNVTWSNDFSGLSDECGETGATTVTFTATDDCGNERSTTATFTIVDTTPPAIVPTGEQDACLWPPNHAYHCVDAADLPVTAEDDCGPVAMRLSACHSSQPADVGRGGDGNTVDDCVISPDGRQVCMRAERAGEAPAGRSYEIEVTAIDDCGNETRGTAMTVFVPHDPHDESDADDCLRAERRELPF